MLNLAKSVVEFPEAFRKSGQPFGQDLCRRIVGGPGDFAEFVACGAAHGAALLMSGDRIGRH
jgi:hypothetical protein